LSDSRGGQDLGASLLFMAIGVVGLWVGREYDFGTTANMGPGFVPMMLSGLLVVLGVLLGARALMRTAGFAPAVALTALMAAGASRETRWAEALVLAVALSIVCVLIFVVALHQPIAVFGPG
jgi:lysylphosphatidylglycerol synthetase-like protein (DUF2156 family)